MTPRYRSRAVSDIPRSRRPAWASGNNFRNTSSAGEIHPTAGQYNCALIPSRAPARRFSSAAWNDI